MSKKKTVHYAKRYTKIHGKTYSRTIVAAQCNWAVQTSGMTKDISKVTCPICKVKLLEEKIRNW